MKIAQIRRQNLKLGMSYPTSFTSFYIIPSPSLPLWDPVNKSHLLQRDIESGLWEVQRVFKYMYVVVTCLKYPKIVKESEFQVNIGEPCTSNVYAIFKLFNLKFTGQISASSQVFHV